jgi:hypothetical protein
MSDQGVCIDSLLMSVDSKTSSVLCKALSDLRIPMLSWLTPNIEKGPLLFIGNGNHPLPTEVNWSHPVHVLVESETQALAISELSACTPTPTIVINSWKPGDLLPFPDHHFAGILTLPYGYLPLASELNRVLSDDGFVLSTETNTSIAGLKSNRRWTLQYDKNETLRLFDHSNIKFIKTGQPLLTSYIQLIPTRLLSKLMRTDIISRSAQPYETKLDRVIHLSQKLEIDPALEMLPPIIQVKDKLTVSFLKNGRASSFLKIPLTKTSSRGLEDAAKMITQLQSSLPEDQSLRKLIPSSVIPVEATNCRAWLESSCKGVPLASITDTSAKLKVADDVARIVRIISKLNKFTPKLPTLGPNTHSRYSLFSLLAPQEPELTTIMSHIYTMLDGELPQSLLRKGDFSLNNILINNGVISGLIDWDECGTTKFHLANLADFMMSWMWHVEGLSRAASLDILLSGNYSTFDSGFDIQHLLDIAGGSKRDLALGTLESWSDHTYHELKYLFMRTKPMRTSTLLTQPLRAIDKHLSTWSI